MVCNLTSEVWGEGSSNKLNEWKKAHLLDSDRLCQISWEIDIDTSSYCNMIRKQLERDDVEETLKGIDCSWNTNNLATGIGYALIAFIGNNDRLSLACSDLLES
jgi:hypothetical protein